MQGWATRPTWPAGESSSSRARTKKAEAAALTHAGEGAATAGRSRGVGDDQIRSLRTRSGRIRRNSQRGSGEETPATAAPAGFCRERERGLRERETRGRGRRGGASSPGRRRHRRGARRRRRGDEVEGQRGGGAGEVGRRGFGAGDARDQAAAERSGPDGLRGLAPGLGGARGWEARGGQVANGEWAREATAAALPTRVAPRGGGEVEAREERQVAAAERAGAESDEGGGG